MSELEKLKEMLRREIEGIHQEGCRTRNGGHYLNCNCQDIVRAALEEPEER